MGGAYQQEVDLQALFKDVASEYLVEVNVPAAAAQRDRPRLPHRARPPRPDGRDHPERPAERALRRAGARVQAGAVEPARRVRAPRVVAGPGRGRARRRGPQRRAIGSPILVGQGARGAADGGRAGRRRARRGRGEGAARQGRAARRPAVRHRVDRPAGHPAQLRADARLRHAADRRLQLPVQPVPARVRQGAGRADRHRRRADRDALPDRAQHRRRRRGATLRALLPLLAPRSDRTWRETVEKNVADWWATVERQAWSTPTR